MATVNIKIRMDKELKEQFENFCDDIGMTTDEVYTLFARETVTRNKFPFEIGEDIPNGTTRKAIDDAKNGIGLSRPFSSVDELMKDLDSED